MRARTATQADRERFDDFVSRSPKADVLQSWDWGEVKRDSGWAPERFLVEDGDRILATALVLRTRPFRGMPPILYAPRGPVLDPSRADALPCLTGEIARQARGAFVLKCDPPLEAGSPEAAALLAGGFRPAGGGGFGGVQPSTVMVLDLDPGEDAIFAGFKSKWRYNIRLAERKGVQVSAAGREDLPAFYELLTETARRDGFLVRNRAYFERLFDVLAPGKAHLFMARHEGVPVAGALLFTLGPRAMYVYGASSSTRRDVMPNHLMQWHMIRWSKRNGFTVYDFRGVSPVRGGAAVEEHLAGLNRFKEGFGARYVEYVGECDLPLRRLVWRAWKAGAPPAMKLYRRIRGGSGAAE